MSKFEELCKAYAASRQAYRESCEACQDFSEIFIKQMSDYLECQIEKQNQKFDEDGVLHFNPHSADIQADFISKKFRIAKTSND
ncbi:hypothetical protein QUB05_32420, partial [Microcoleus sp. F10-C6]